MRRSSNIGRRQHKMSKSEHKSYSDEDYVDTSEDPVRLSDETYGITAEMIQKHKELLKDRLADTKFGIIDKLLANDGLTNQETTAIEECSTDPYVRSKTLIDVVLQKTIISEFIRALEDTHQKHLINYLRGDGVQSAEFGDEWPLGDDLIKQLNVNQGHLIDIIDTRFGLTDLLFSEQVINERQSRFISEEMNRTSKNKILLNIIRRKSVKDYNITVECLIQSGQAHIANVLKDKGVIQRIRISQENSQTLNQTENELSDRLTDLLMNRSNEEAQRILEMTHLKLFAAKKGKSIYLYIYCATIEELIELHNMVVTGAVKEIVEKLFNALVTRQERIVVSCTFSEEEYDTCKSYFEEGKPPNSESASASEENIGTSRHNVQIEAKQKLNSKVKQTDLQQDQDFDNFRRHILPRPDHMGMLFCGSFYELPLEYALLILTDLDQMFFPRNIIAATETATAPEHFKGEILILETKGCHLGFAKLLRRREGKTQPCKWSRRQLPNVPAVQIRILEEITVRKIYLAALKYIPYARRLMDYTVDNVCSVLCPHWPSEADEWKCRERCNGWPTRDMIEKIVDGGCHLVPKAPDSNPSDETSWRFSFSQAELILLNNWNDVQKYIYHILRRVKSDMVEIADKCDGEKTFLRTYHFKTLMLWACEERSPRFWNDDRIEESTKELLLQMKQYLTGKNCPNYFIRKYNMLDYLQSDSDITVEKHIRYISENASEFVSNEIASTPKVNRGKTIQVRVSDKVLLLGQLAINRRVFINPLDQNRRRFVVENLSSSALFRQEVKDLFRAVNLHRFLMTELSSSEAEIRERQDTCDTEAFGYFQISYNKRKSNNYTNVYISSLDSFTSAAHSFLHGAPIEHRQPASCNRLADIIKNQLTEFFMGAMSKYLMSELDDNHHNPSFFISAAYYANFCYTGQQEYRQALKICEEALECFKKLKDRLNLNTFEKAFTNEILCLFINRQYVKIYDAGFQAVFGFRTLCMTIIKQNEKDASDQRVSLDDLVFQVCPVEFLEYIRIRCRNKLHLNERSLHEAQHFFHTSAPTNLEEITCHKKLSNAILAAAISVDF